VSHNLATGTRRQHVRQQSCTQTRSMLTGSCEMRSGHVTTCVRCRCVPPTPKRHGARAMHDVILIADRF
jgi:hypothetical protein